MNTPFAKENFRSFFWAVELVTAFFSRLSLVYKNLSTVIELEKRGCCQYGLLAVYGHPKRGLNGNDYSSTPLCAGIEANTDLLAFTL